MRLLTKLLVVSVLAALFAVPAVASEEGRTISKPYTITRGEFHASSEEAGWWIGTQPVLFHPSAYEEWLTLSIVDDSGRPVRGRAKLGDLVVEFCSTTERPIRVEPEQNIAVSAIVGMCNGTLSVLTEGTITATFSS